MLVKGSGIKGSGIIKEGVGRKIVRSLVRECWL